MTPWMTPETANLVGSVMGAVFGVLGGGIGGPLVGYLAPRGRARSAVLGTMIGVAVIGVGLLVTALVAWQQGQPRYVIYPFALCGLVMTFVVTPLIPVIRMRYRQAEARRLEAEELRRG